MALDEYVEFLNRQQKYMLRFPDKGKHPASFKRVSTSYKFREAL